MIDNDYEGSRLEFMKLLADQGEEPAFVVRRRRLDTAFEQLRRNCRTEQLSLLKGPRLHLRKLHASLCGDWSKLSPHLVSPSKWRFFQSLHNELDQASPEPQWSNHGLLFGSPNRLLAELFTSADRFNRRRTEYINAVNLSEINRMIADYNRYFVIEKSCAFGSDEIGATGFEPLAMINTGWFDDAFPNLQIPASKAR